VFKSRTKKSWMDFGNETLVGDDDYGHETELWIMAIGGTF